MHRSFATRFGASFGDVSEREAIAFVVDDSLTGLCVFTEALRRKWRIALISRPLASKALYNNLRNLGYCLFDTRAALLIPALRRCSIESDFLATSSGTTGVPKFFGHCSDSLVKKTVANKGTEQRLLLTFWPGTFAWFDVVRRALTDPSLSLVVGPLTSPHELWESARLAKPSSVSATPSFFRSLLLSNAIDDRDSAQFFQITLGGEAVDQPLLDLLRARFPNARLTHTYASSEAGLVLWTHDGKVGFGPDAIEVARHRGIEVSVSAGKLLVRLMSKNLEIVTEDYAESKDGRLLVFGRDPALQANIGGAKVAIEHIVTAIKQVPDVIQARVRTVPSQLVGQLLTAQVSICSPLALLSDAEVSSFLSREIQARGVASVFVPRIWTIRRTIALSNNFKEELAPDVG